MEVKTETYFTDMIMEAPHAFSAGRRTYYLYPMTLGKLMLVQRILENIGVDSGTLAFAPMLEVIKIVGLNRDSCLRMIAFAVSKSKDECYNVKHIKSLVKELSTSLTDEDIATLIVYITTNDKSAEIRKHYKIDEENEAMSTALRVKSDKSSLSFGGKTILGALIDPACERYGWTVDYVVWGISYATLRLMMVDKINTIYLSSDEREKVPGRILQKDESVIVANKENMELIKSMDWR